MKKTSFLAVLSVLAFAWSPSLWAQAEVGAVSDDVQFSLFENGSLIDKRLSDFAGKVILINYYTPW